MRIHSDLTPSDPRSRIRQWTISLPDRRRVNPQARALNQRWTIRTVTHRHRGCAGEAEVDAAGRLRGARSGLERDGARRAVDIVMDPPTDAVGHRAPRRARVERSRGWLSRQSTTVQGRALHAHDGPVRGARIPVGRGPPGRARSSRAQRHPARAHRRLRGESLPWTFTLLMATRKLEWPSPGQHQSC